MDQQLTWEFIINNQQAESERNTPEWRCRLELRRAVVRWLLETQKPSGAAVDVVTRISRLRADIAAFWSRAVRNPNREGPVQVLHPWRTAIIQCYRSRDECWPDCSRSAELVPQLRDLKKQQKEIEEEIRRTEPDLRDENTLFDEYAEWHYENSRNRSYNRMRKEIDKIEQALYRGTQFERIRQASVADQLFLAVPTGLIQPDELADGWGLLWVDDDLKVVPVATPDSRECLEENRIHLVQHIAAAASSAVMFSLGLHTQASGKIVFVKPPRRHRRPQVPKLPK